jgi:hypothetical protein
MQLYTLFSNVVISVIAKIFVSNVVGRLKIYSRTVEDGIA